MFTVTGIDANGLVADYRPPTDAELVEVLRERRLWARRTLGLGRQLIRMPIGKRTAYAALTRSRQAARRRRSHRAAAAVTRTRSSSRGDPSREPDPALATVPLGSVA